MRPPAIPTTTPRPGATSWPTPILADAGYAWEEISNWALPGHECRHNHLYWEQGDYVGIGSAAHSHRDGVRWWNVRTPERYVDAVEQGRSPEAGREELHGGPAPLRGAHPRAAHPARRPVGLAARRRRDPTTSPTVAPRASTSLEGLVVREGDRAVLTVRGRLLANEVSARIGSGILRR